MALETEDFDFMGKIRLPLPKTFSGIPADWEEWSWNFKAYISMFDTTVKTFMENAEGRTVPIVDDDLQVTFDTGDVNDDATQKAVTFSRKLHYLLANLTSDAAVSCTCSWVFYGDTFHHLIPPEFWLKGWTFTFA